MNKKINELEKAVDDLEDRIYELEDKTNPWIAAITIVGLILFIIFIISVLIADGYSEYPEFNYNCDDIEKMIILDEFPRNIVKEQKYLDPFFKDRLNNGRINYRESDFRDYYLLNCFGKKEAIGG